MRWYIAGFVAWCVGVGAAGGETAEQSTWSGGGGEPGPVTEWEDRFEESDGVSWLSIPGQLALGSVPIDPPATHLLDGSLTRPFGIRAVDLDRDGDNDILGTAGTSNVVAVWWNQGGDPVTWERQIVDAAFRGAAGITARDIDGDGHLDVIASAESPGHQVAWWRNSGDSPPAWTRQSVAGGYTIACGVDAADLNGDERCDILSVSGGLGEITWWRNEGGDPILWTRLPIDTDFAGAHGVHAADIDGDGDTDVVGAAGLAGDVAWWRNDGGDPIAWVRETLCPTCVGARTAHAADVNGDGRCDIVGGAFEQRLSWWRNEGGDPVTWREYLIDGTQVGLHSIYVADLDGDGFRDVLTAGADGDEIVWLRNEGGDPPTWSRQPLAPDFTGAATAHAADLDRDGDLDVVGASIGRGEFTWWEISRFMESGSLTSSILDTEGAPASADIVYAGSEPAGTSIQLLVRSGEEAGSMGPWSETITEPQRFVQYRILLESAESGSSPVLHEVRYSWESSASVEDASPVRIEVPSPVVGSPVVGLALEVPGQVGLALFDPAGRLVIREPTRRLSAGTHAIALDALHPGVYFCLVRTDEKATRRRVVVLE